MRVARAVREGRTTWAEIVSGRANAVPEVVAFQERTRAELARLLETLPDLAGMPPKPTETPPHEHGDDDEDDDEDFEVRWVRR